MSTVTWPAAMPNAAAAAASKTSSTRCASRKWAPGPGGVPPRQLVHEGLAARTQLDLRQREHEQPDAAVDVVADPARRDDPVRELGCRETAHRKAVALADVGQ